MIQLPSIEFYATDMILTSVTNMDYEFMITGHAPSAVWLDEDYLEEVLEVSIESEFRFGAAYDDQYTKDALSLLNKWMIDETLLTIASSEIANGFWSHDDRLVTPRS